MEISKVPPPRSYTATVPVFFLSKPYASAAAVGSLTMSRTTKVINPLILKKKID